MSILVPTALRDRSMRIFSPFFFFFFFLIIPERQTILWTAEPTNGNESISARKASRYRLVEKPPGSLIPRPDHLRVSWQYFIKPEPLAAH